MRATAFCVFLLLALSASSCNAQHHGHWVWRHGKRVVIVVDDPVESPEPKVTAPARDGEDCLSVAEIAVEAELNTLVAALTAADLANAVGEEFVGTVFAPTEEAFGALLEALNVTPEELLANTELLTQVLLIHVIPDVVAFAADLEDGQEIPTAAEGVFVTVSLEDEKVFIVAPSGVRAQVVTADVEACNAVVHVIDAVLTPAAEEEEAPRRARAEARASATATGEETTTEATTTVEEDHDDDDEACTSVAEVAVNAQLNTLVAALTAADLANAVGPDFVGTVFAPTEEAFAALLAALEVTAEELLADTELLTQVLLIHVIPDVVAFLTDLEDNQEIPTAAEGVVVTVSLEDDRVFIVAPSGVRAQVVAPDFEACNAVVHVIDAVLTPAAEEEEEEEAPRRARAEARASATATGDETTAEATTTVEEDDDDECTSAAEVAVNAQLDTLVAALTAADLANAVGPDFVGTVFAPTEEAFAALLAALEVTAEELLADTELLTQVLLIHVIPDVVAFSTDLEDGQEIPTAAEGVSVTVSIRRGNVFIIAPSGVRAQVVTPNIVACDAVVHVIDAVLTPAP